MAIVYLGLGSNKGDRIGYVQQATRLLGETSGIKIIRASSFYETQPWLEKDTTWFINAVVEARVQISPQELLQECLRIEQQLGRKREIEGHHGDRTIDIDILFYGKEIIEEENLHIPHSLIDKRAFVLVPMLEINPDLLHPQTGKSISLMHEELDNPEAVYLYGTRLENV